MGAAALAWAYMAGRRAGRTARLVLRELARQADGDAGVVITIGALAAAAACTPRQITRSVRELEGLGLIRVQAMPGTVSVYTLLMQQAEAEGAEVAGGAGR